MDIFGILTLIGGFTYSCMEWMLWELGWRKYQEAS